MRTHKPSLMVEAIVKLTHSLGIPVLAEGVETEQQERILKEIGCDIAQGWLYGKAMPNGELQVHLARADTTLPRSIPPSLTA